MTLLRWPLFLLATGLALANDAPFIHSGTPKPMNGEHPHLRMVREDVYLKVYFRNYDVDARFEFYNDGPAQTVTMGFPEWAHDYDSKRSGFQRFTTLVDGVPVPTRRIVPEVLTRYDYRAWWLKTVHFNAYQTRHITVRFTAPVDGTPDGPGFHAVGYHFTGQAWKGKVRESRLTIRLPYSGARLGGFARGVGGYTDKTPGVSFSGRWVHFARRNWQAQEPFEIVFRDPLDFPPAREEVKESDLRGKSAWQLTVMRNEIVARHGRPFSDPALRSHFNAQSWYSVDPDYSDRHLEPWERKSMQAIQDYQDRHHLNL